MKENKKLIDRIISFIEQNPDLTWQQAYKSSFNLLNISTGKKYRGGNRLLLTFQNFGKTNLFCTFKQSQSLNLKMKKGSKGCYVHFFSFIHKDKNGKTVTDVNKADSSFPLSRYYTVFSIDCFEDSQEKTDLLNKYSEDVETFDNKNIENIESDVLNYFKNERIDYSLDTNDVMPHYNFIKDSIALPDLKFWNNAESFYKTLFHEIAHSTGSDTRLKRNLKNNSKKKYADEELIAELSASQLANEYNIFNDDNLKDTSSYLKSWLSVLRKNPNSLFISANHADKATQFFLDNCN